MAKKAATTAIPAPDALLAGHATHAPAELLTLSTSPSTTSSATAASNNTANTSSNTTANTTAAAKPYTVLARRYRSRDFGEVIGQEPIARTLQNAIEYGRTAHAYLFCGTRGVGKTSMARIYARALNRNPALSESDAIGDAILRGEDLDVIEIDGASNRGIDDARDLIAGAGLAPTRGKYRIYIIDEVHMLTTPAFNALLKTMEEPPSHVKFILCTTEPHKVPQTIQSRCQRFDFRNIPTKQIAAHLGAVASGEGIEVTEDVLLAVARLANGSMRDGLSLLDRLLASAVGRIDATVLEQVFGLPDDEILLSIVEACVCERTADALLHGSRLLERGSGVEQALELLAERFRWVLVAAAAGIDSDLLEVAASMRDRVARVAAQTDVALAAHAIALCDATARNARGSSAPRALYDACLARLSLSQRFAGGASLLAGGGGADSKKAVDPVTRRVAGQPASSVHELSASTGSTASTASNASNASTTLRPSISASATTHDTRAATSSVTASKPAPIARTSSVSSTTPASVATSTSTAPLNESTAYAPTTDFAELRRRLVEIGARSARDHSLTQQGEITEFSGDSAKVLVDGTTASGQYLITNPQPMQTLLTRAAGRPVRVLIVADPNKHATVTVKPMALDDASVRNDPLVRLAAELFDATIVAVSARVQVDDAATDANDDASGAESESSIASPTSIVDAIESGSDD